MSLLGTLGLPTMDAGVVTALWFAAAVLLVDRFDISLPRGDSMGVSGALVAAGLLVANVAWMAALALLAVPIANLARADQEYRRVVDAFLTRAVSLLGTLTVMYALGRTGTWGTALSLFAIPITYLVAEVVAAQSVQSWRTSRSLGRLLSGNLRRQIPLLGAQASTAILAAITYPKMGAWGLLLVVALLMLTRQSLAALMEMRETYRATVEVLVEAAEGQDTLRAGHADRSAHVAREIADRMGLSGVLMERASYATLLHDLNTLSSPALGDPATVAWKSSDVLEGSAFFEDVLPILRLCDGRPSECDATEQNVTVAMIAALSSDIDMLALSPDAFVHGGSGVESVAPYVPAEIKARVVACAIELGYRTPAVP